MIQTQSAPEGSETSGARKQADQAIARVDDRRAREHARRRRHWARRELEAIAGVRRTLPAAADAGDYWADVGMTLGMPERVAAGIALKERAA